MKKLLIMIVLNAIVFSLALGCAAVAEDGIYVYRDYMSEDNHFNMKAMMFADGRQDLVIPLNEDFRESPYSGESCIRCQVNVEAKTWGGWLFMTGMQADGQAFLNMNDGSTPDQGLDLTGTRALSFMARGRDGGEKVEFICFGFGENDQSVAYPDTAAKRSKVFTLTDEWQEYTIDYSADNLDLSNISLGFGFACSEDISGIGEHIFYLDELRFLK